ncbi:MAG: D-alanine--D-alanine ligase [Gemmatimonadaceae bacterium]|nr:D-alanine--D-alanine ligase [Gemmatimonadaceae bacterium]
MTRIGFAFNLKPEPETPRLERDAETAVPEEEPPSSRTAIRLDSVVDDEFAEWDSEATIAAVEQALAPLGQVIRLEADASFPERLRRARPDIVFNIAEGLHGVNREAHVPAICEFFGIPYSGSDPFTLSLGLDKARTKEVLSHHGVPNAAFELVRDERDLGALLNRVGKTGIGDGEWVTPKRNVGRERESRSSRSVRETVLHSPSSNSHSPTRLLQLPLFVKPVHEGSSKGITDKSFCRTLGELEEQIRFLLERYEQPVLVEEYLPGAEFTCAVLGNGPEAEVLPIVGMNFAALPDGAVPVYSFEAKWLWDRPENPLAIFECPARIDAALERRITAVVLDAYRVLGCRDWSRIDVRLDAAGEPNVVEVNPLPGILPDPEDNSCFPKAARAAGMSYTELIQACLRHAAERQGVSLPVVAVSGVAGAAAVG